jgi:prevent-host-death family protein
MTHRLDFTVVTFHTCPMTYTVQQAQEDFGKLLKEAEEGHEVVIERDGKPVARLAPFAEEQPKAKRILGQYAGQHHYSDDVFKPLETDEELRELGFDILADAKVIDEPAA